MTYDPYISPRYRQSDLGIKSPVDIFEDQTRGWVLDYAKRLAADRSDNHQSIAVLMLATSYFEQIECFRSGESSEGKSPKFFKRTVKRLFSDLSPDGQKVATNVLYEDLRRRRPADWATRRRAERRSHRRATSLRDHRSADFSSLRR